MKKFVAAIIVFAISFLQVILSSAGPLKIDAQSCILIELKSGQVLYEENASEKQVYPASTTKILTAILALEMGDPDQLMTASVAAVNDIGKDGMNIGIMPGEQIPLANLLEALLIRSANETANIIAENLCPTRDEFVRLMNEKAKEIGAVNTHFTNPCGNHDDNHRTTAADMAKIARYAMSIPKFREIVCKKSFIMPPTNKHSEWPELASTNDFLKYDSNDLFTVTGIKTGYTAPAGQCLVSSAVNKDGLELIAVVMGVNGANAKKNIREYSKQLYEYGFENYSVQRVIEQGHVVKENIHVVGAKDGSLLSLITGSDLSCVLPINKDDWNLETREYIKSIIEAPVQEGEPLGYIEYWRNGTHLGKVSIVAATSVERYPAPEDSSNLEEITGYSILKGVLIKVLIVLTSFVALKTILRIISRKIRSRRYNN